MMTRRLRILMFVCLVLAIAGMSSVPLAQEAVEVLEAVETEAAETTRPEELAAQQQAQQEAAIEQENEQQVRKTFEVAKPAFSPQEYNSLFFTAWEMENIERMRRIANSTDRGLTRQVLNPDVGQEFDESIQKVKPPPEKREIRLAGILYEGKDSWTIWLNEQRVTPDALPREVIDLKVYKEYIEFKWFDDYTNRIYPIRLRPHQRFNMDTRIFLPG